MSGALAIILARAGSEGLPGKNIRPIAGRPCISWTIEHAQLAAGVSSVIVSSDCVEARSIAVSMGAGFVERPESLAGASALVDAAARHAASVADSPRHFASIVLLYANVPVRPADLTDRALCLLWSGGCDSVQSYVPVGKNHPWWTATLDDEGTVGAWDGGALNHGVYRRQDLPPAFVPDGGVIALRRAALDLEIPCVQPGPHAFLGKDRRGVETSPGDVIDIDTRADAIVAGAVLGERPDAAEEAA